MKTRGRIVVSAALAAVVMGIAGHTAYWHLLARGLEQGFDAWAAGRRARGWNLSHGTPIRSGWPLEARLEVPELRLSSSGALVPGGITWSAPITALRLGLLQPRVLLIEPQGAQRIAVGGTEIPFAADRIALSLHIEPGVPPTDGTLQTQMLRIGTTTGAVIVDRGTVTWRVRTAAEGEPAVTLDVGAETITLPRGPVTVLGDRLQGVAIDAVLTGPTVYTSGPRQRAEEWRDGGGTLELRRMGFTIGSTGVESSATIALDDSLQPMGAATTRITGARQALDLLAKAGLLPQRAAGMAQAALPLMTRRADNGEAYVEVPLTLQDRRLTLGRIPILRVPFWTWEAP